MSDEVPKTRTMAISEVEENLHDLVRTIAIQETRVVVEENGVPVAALVSPADLARLAWVDQERAERWRVVNAMREPFRDVPYEEIEREAEKAVAEVKAEMRAEREAAAAKR